MRWEVAAKAEIVHAAYDSRPKEMMPDAVDDHPCRQRISRIGEPFRQLRPATRIRRNRMARRAGGNDLNEAARHFGAELIRVAANRDFCIRWRRHFLGGK